MTVITPQFRIYYGDGSVFDGEPEDAPTDDVQIIVWDDPTRGNGDIGRGSVYEYDIYIYSDDIGWHGTDKYADLLKHLKRKGLGPCGVRAVLEGFWIPRPTYLAIKDRAFNDPPFRRKSANRKYECGRQ